MLDISNPTLLDFPLSESLQEMLVTELRLYSFSPTCFDHLLHQIATSPNSSELITPISEIMDIEGIIDILPPIIPSSISDLGLDEEDFISRHLLIFIRMICSPNPCTLNVMGHVFLEYLIRCADDCPVLGHTQTKLLNMFAKYSCSSDGNVLDDPFGQFYLAFRSLKDLYYIQNTNNLGLLPFSPATTEVSAYGITDHSITVLEVLYEINTTELFCDIDFPVPSSLTRTYARLSDSQYRESVLYNYSATLEHYPNSYFILDPNEYK